MNYPLLDQVKSPADLRSLPKTRLAALASELREFIIESVSQSGGHLASGLGVVELTLALHYVYNTPADKIVWDVGHQCYPHKVLTGRREQMPSMRKKDGLGGFPRREESNYDTFNTGHSSTSISAALGMAVAAEKNGMPNKAIAVIGDGAMTAGLAFEALHHAGGLRQNMLVVLNDNDMSISPNVGGLSEYMARAMSNKLLLSVREGGKEILSALPPVKDLARRAEGHVKGMMTPGTLFEELGFNYIGPIDGHDVDLLVRTLENIKPLNGPVLLHIKTAKGKGYKLAEEAPTTYHGVSAFDPSKGMQKSIANSPTYSSVFGQWLCDMASQDERLLAITPAMREGSGMIGFSEQYPERYFDVAIAEQHALTLAAGMACEGMKPVVAIYSTFLQRGYDQLVHDIVLQNLPVLFAIDRAGHVGQDGSTHAGSFDLVFMRCLPNMTIMTPSSENESRQMLSTGFQLNGPAAVRYPKGVGTGEEIDTTLLPLPVGKAELIRKGGGVAILVFGTLLSAARPVAEKLDASLVNMRFVKPLDTGLIELMANSHEVLVTIEEGAIAGGAGSGVAEYLNSQGIQKKIIQIGIDDSFYEHASRDEQLEESGLSSEGILNQIVRHPAYSDCIKDKASIPS